MQELKFNLNNYIKAKLTSRGLKVYCAYHHLDQMPNWRAPDEDGYYTFQLWQFMLIFGQELNLGRELPCATEIKLMAQLD